MIFLPLTTSKLQLVSTSTANLDVEVSWVDRTDNSNSDPDSTLTAISSATTTDIVASPTSGIVRLIKGMTVRNKHASTTQVVTIQITDGTITVEKFKCTLLAGEMLQFHERAGFWICDNQGRVKQALVTNAGAPITSGYGVVVLASDVTNNNAVANTIQDVTGLAFPVVAGKFYWFEFHVAFTAAATATGSRWSITGPASPTYLNYESRYSLTNTTETRNALLQAYDQPAASNATSATTGNNWARIEGIIQPSADGNVIARFASEVLSSAIVAKAGSFVKYFQTN